MFREFIITHIEIYKSIFSCSKSCVKEIKKLKLWIIKTKEIKIKKTII